MTTLVEWLRDALDATESWLRACEASMPLSLVETLERSVRAHREILDRHQPDAIGCRWCWERDWPCPDVRSLAAIYRDHPGFDPSWIGES